MTKLDARGLSCPEPVILFRNAAKAGDNEFEILVDNHAARENVTRCGEHLGYRVSVTEQEGVYTLTMTK